MIPDNSFGERMARVEEQVRQMKNEIAELNRALNGPNGSSLRARVHKLENDSAAASAAHAALAAFQQMRGQTWTRKERLGLFLFAGVGAVGTIISVVVLVQP